MNINYTLFGQGFAFFLFVIFCMNYVWPPIIGAINERQKKIKDGLDAAEKAKADLASAEKDIEQELDEAKSKAASLIEQASKNANQIIEDAKVQAEQEAERSVLGAEKILQEEVNAQNHATMLNQLANKL